MRGNVMDIGDATRKMHDQQSLAFHYGALDLYVRHLSGRIHRYALPNVGRLQAICGKQEWDRHALTEYMGAKGTEHALYEPDLPWLTLFETQTCRALKLFVEEPTGKGPARGMALLKALSPEFPWPNEADVSGLKVDIEVECPRTRSRGGSTPRIDMIITVESLGVKYGAVIEVKTRNQQVNNPLGAYTEFAKNIGLRSISDQDGSPNAVFVVLVPKRTVRLRRRILNHHNRHWRIMEWPVFLRRMERLISDDDKSYRQFRRILWKTIDGTN